MGAHNKALPCHDCVFARHGPPAHAQHPYRLDEHARSAPLTRIRNLDILWRRHARFTRDRSPYELDESVVLTDMTLDQIQEDMARDRIFLPVKGEEDMADTVLRIYDRDTHRMAAAQDRAQELLDMSGGHMKVGLIDCRVAEHSLELHDLLEYIHARLEYKHSCYYFHPKEEVGLHHRFPWHVSFEDFPVLETV